MDRSAYVRLRRIYLNAAFYARHGRTRYNGQSFKGISANKSELKKAQRQLVALRASR